jgi:hypothetical protein
MAGQTGYIDFIKPSELMNHSIMKGIDYGNRRFLVFKSETEVNGINVQMFTTFFQRYSNNPTLYHTAGNYTKYLFDTAGGCNLIKLKYLRDLLKNRELNLNYEGVENFNVTYRSLYKYTDEEKSAVNDTIRIGWSPCDSIHIGSTVDGEISIIENNEYSSPPQPPTDEEGEYLFKEMGKPPRYKHVPVALLDVIIRVLQTLAWFIPPLAAKAELARIGRYYATESMLVWDAQSSRYDAQTTPSFGTQTLFAHYDQLLAGQADVQLGEHSVF